MMKRKLATTKYFSAKRLATLAVLCAMGLIMFMVESLFPPLFLPGAKMGLSNIFSLLALYLLGPIDAFILVVVRVVLGSMFTGNMSTLMYSLTAGVVSVVVSSILVQLVYPRVSIVSISIVSAVLHNLTQNIVFCLVSNTPQMFSYMPWLGLLGILAGIIVGFAVWFILKMIPTRTFAAMLNLDLSVITPAEPQADEQTSKTELKDATAQSSETAALQQTVDQSENAGEQQLATDAPTDKQPAATDDNADNA